MFPNNNSAPGWVGSGGSVREVQGLEIMNREGNTFQYKVNEMMIYILDTQNIYLSIKSIGNI